MPKIDIQGLPGLRGFSQLSADEKKSWLATHPSAVGKTAADVEVLYKNNTFYETYGSDLFYGLTPEQRDEYRLGDVVQNTFDQYYKGNQNYDELNHLTTRGKMALFEAGYSSDEELAKQEEDLRNSIQSQEDWYKEHPFLANMREAHFATRGFGYGEHDTVAESGIENYIQSAAKTNAKILADVQSEDNQRKQESVAGDVDVILDSWQHAISSGELSDEELEDNFEKIAYGGTETIDTDFGSVDYNTPGSRYYRAFKGSRFLELQPEDKKKMLATYMAMQAKYGEYDASSNLETQLQQFVADSENFWDWAGKTGRAVATGSVAYLNSKINFFTENYYALQGPEQLANFLEGKKADGTDRLAAWYNPFNAQYWEGVEQFYAFSPAKIQQARENGGLSRYQWVVEPGKESDLWSAGTAHEALKMAKFAIVDGLINKGLGAASSAAVVRAGGVFNPATGALEKSLSTNTSRYLNKALRAGIAVNSAGGIAQSYSVMAYNQALEETKQLLDEKQARDVDAWVKQQLSTPENQALIDNYVQKRMAEQPSTTERGLAISENEFRRQATEELSSVLTQQYLNSDSVKAQRQQDEQEARTDAATTALITEAIEAARYSVENVAFRGWLFDKGTNATWRAQNPYLRAREIGGTLTTEGKVANVVKPIAKNIWGGFQSNYLDDVTVGFSKGFGVSEFNNYLEQKYDPERYAASHQFTTELLDNLDGALRGGKSALTEWQSIYDGFIGAIGGPMGLIPNIGGIISDVKAKRGFTTDVLGNTITPIEGLAKYVNNPIIYELAQAKARSRAFQTSIDKAQQTIASNRESLERIANLATGLNTIDVAQTTERDMMKAKDAKARQAFNLVTALKKWSEDPILSQSSAIQNAQQTLTQLANGTMDQAQLNQLVTEFLGQSDNADIAKLPNAKEIAIERLKKNTNQLLEMQKKYQEVSKVLDDSAIGAFMQGDIRDSYIFQLAMDDNWASRISEMETAITGRSKPGTTTSKAAEYGTYKNWRAKQQAQSQNIERIQDEIETAQAQLDIISSEMKKARGEEKNFVRIKRNSQELLLKTLKTSLAEAKEALATINADESLFKDTAGNIVEAPFEVLQAAEILALEPQQRAQMLFEKNRDIYSKEQRAVINGLISELRAKDPDAITKINDISRLSNEIELNRISEERFRENPEAAMDYLQALKASRVNNIVNVWANRAYMRIEDTLNDAAASNTLFDVAKAVNTSAEMLERYAKDHPERAEVIKPIIDVRKLQADAVNIINSIERAPEVKQVYLQAVDAATRAASSLEEAMDNLEDTLTAQTDGAAFADLSAIMSRLEGLNYQRNATKVRDRETERKIRAEKEAQQAEIERQKDGKNFGWEGYKKGTTVYTLTPDGRVRQGYVRYFRGDNGGEMVVKWSDSKDDFIYNAKTDKNRISTAIPQTEAPETYTPAQKVDKEGKNLIPAEEAPVKGQIPTAETFTGEAEDVILEQTGKLNSPSVEKQAAEVKDRPTGVQPVVAVDPTDGGNNIQSELPTSLLGNLLYEYDVKQLVDFGIQKRRAGKTATDTMSQFFKWLDDNKIQLQEIIDNELGNILTENPDISIQFLLRKPIGTKIDDAIQNLAINVIEYTPSVRKHHNEDRGGVITANGKQYLVVGLLGFANGAQAPSFNNMLNSMKVNRKNYFDVNPSEIYYVDPTYSTRIQDMTSGRITRQLLGDSEIQIRTLGELLSDRTRNPEGLEFVDLKWRIQQGDTCVNIGLTGNEKVYPPVDAEGTKGGVFLLTKAANGRYIPIAIRPTMLTELKEGSLKDQIYTLINECAAPKRESRIDAIKQLVQILNLTDKDNILVGDAKHNNVTVVKDSNIIGSFELGENFDRAGFIAAVNRANFRVNLTASTLTNPTLLAEYDRAGAVTTDVAKLGTSNSWYTVYPCDSEGKPIVTAPVENTGTSRGTNSEYTRKYTQSVLHQGKVYRERDGIFYDEVGKQVTPELATKLSYRQWIRTTQTQPAKVTNGTSYYIVVSDAQNPTVIKETPDGDIVVASEKQAKRFMQDISAANQRAQMEQAAQQQLDIADAQAQAMRMGQVEQIGTEDVSLTDEQLAQQMVGNFETPTKQEVINETLQETKPEIPIRRKQDVNVAGNKSLTELQESKNLTNFVSIYASRTYRKQLNDIAKSKGWNWGSTKEEHEAFLRKLRVETTNIGNVESWLDMIKNCK